MHFAFIAAFSCCSCYCRIIDYFSLYAVDFSHFNNFIVRFLNNLTKFSLAFLCGGDSHTACFTENDKLNGGMMTGLLPPLTITAINNHYLVAGSMANGAVLHTYSGKICCTHFSYVSVTEMLHSRWFVHKALRNILLGITLDIA